MKLTLVQVELLEQFFGAIFQERVGGLLGCLDSGLGVCRTHVVYDAPLLFEAVDGFLGGMDVDIHLLAAAIFVLQTLYL